MIDTHVHIIPEVDDGATSIEESVAMLKSAKEQGVSQMIATPHFKEGISLEADILEQYERVRKEAAAMGVTLHLGNELYLCEEGVEGLRDDHVYTMANSKYVLVELPFMQFYPFHEALLHQIQMRGFKIILAHIDRYQVFRKKPEKLKTMLERGMYTQLNASSLSNRKLKRQALSWIEKGWVHLIASDGHDMLKRPPRLAEAYEKVQHKFGIGAAELLFRDNPERIIHDEPLEALKVHVKRGLFARIRNNI